MLLFHAEYTGSASVVIPSSPSAISAGVFATSVQSVPSFTLAGTVGSVSSALTKCVRSLTCDSVIEIPVLLFHAEYTGSSSVVIPSSPSAMSAGMFDTSVQSVPSFTLAGTVGSVSSALAK